MKASNDLFLLIKSLTKSEKRYVRLYAAKQHSDDTTRYLQLFDALDRMDRYDDAALRARLDPAAGTYLPQVRYYLYKVILKALNQYHAGRLVDAQLNELIQGVEILYDKRLFPQCRKLLTRARKLALRNDRNLHLLQILVHEYRLAILESNPGRKEARVDAIFTEMIALGDRMALRYKYWQVQAKMFMLTTRQGDARSARELKAYERLIDQPLMRSGGPIDDPVTRLIYLFTYDHYYDMTGRRAELVDWRREIVEYIESIPTLRRRLIDRYIPALYNFAQVLIQQGQYAELTRVLRKLDRLSTELRERGEPFNDLHIRLLVPRMHLEKGELKKGAEAIGRLEEEFRASRESLRIGMWTYFCYLSGYLHFGAGDLAQSVVWLNEVLNGRDTELHEELHGYARILSLLVHYELGHLESLESYLASATRFLKKREKALAFERHAIEMVRRLMTAADLDGARHALIAARGKLERLRTDPVEREAFGYLDLLAWIDAKLERRTFAEVMRRTRVLKEEPDATDATRRTGEGKRGKKPAGSRSTRARR